MYLKENLGILILLSLSPSSEGYLAQLAARLPLEVKVSIYD